MSMCFSATASFVAAGMTALVGAATLSRVDSLRALPLAATPLIFAFQQATEGVLWLVLPASPTGFLSSSLIFLFLFFAYVFWPVYVPFAVLLLEPDKRFRRSLLVCLAVGVALSGHLLWWMLTRSHSASIQEEHIVYETGYHASVPVALAYMVATGLPLTLSSHRWVLSLGAVTLVGSVVAYLFYWEAFVSVWCFFAAAASGVVLGHFEGVRRWRLRTAGV
jgi:hypothetical protein